MYNTDCFFFTGYKPCQFKRPCPNCPHYKPVGTRIVIVSLDAMGAVLRSTCLLEPILRKHPDAHITWITLPGCRALLTHNPHIHRLLVVEAATLASITYLQFDILYAVDKSIEAGALAEQIQAKEKWGFGLAPTGVIRPFTPEATYGYQLGLDDQLKFYQNNQTETQILTEAMGLKWERDPYILTLLPEEKLEVQKRRSEMAAALPTSPTGFLGYNTGCSLLFSYKRFTVERAVAMIASWREQFPTYAVLLLGGREDTERQRLMKAAFPNDPYVIDTPTEQGLRSGILWMETSDVVFSGCSLGMHIAIGLQKQVVAWFGVSCIQEIDLYERGVKIQSPVPCSPCWKKTCSNEPKCYDVVPLQEITTAIQTCLHVSA